MKAEPPPLRRELLPAFVVGVAAGLFVGLLASLSPVLSVIAVAAVASLMVLGIARRDDPRRSMVLSGALVGAGTLFTYGAINTVTSCSGTDDFCGNANVWPLLVLAAATFGGGAVGALGIAGRSRT